ncbi:hypothetical protein FOA52_006678 [Chlamydomonas sp. UWO 241]|nr:hypothetical protein FOA52_006678 [Chlamydomonas sp. UWO 241]
MVLASAGSGTSTSGQHGVSMESASPEASKEGHLEAFGRRGVLSGMLAFACAQALPAKAVGVYGLEDAAFEAYANRDFKTAVGLLTDIMDEQPDVPKWLEMRAAVLVDGKNFSAAIADYDKALQMVPDKEPIVRARLLAGRALALEGVSDWEGALADYEKAVVLADAAGESPDPYVTNAIGNCHNSLGQWAQAREAYLVSSQLFQQARGMKGRNGGSTDRLDGAIFSASNAALMLAQMGNLGGAIKEMERIARRAPGSADMRAALAALYYDAGDRARAEDVWEFACTQISVGCSKYKDADWLARIRRWPPVMCQKMASFVLLEPAPAA